MVSACLICDIANLLILMFELDKFSTLSRPLPSTGVYVLSSGQLIQAIGGSLHRSRPVKSHGITIELNMGITETVIDDRAET